MNKDIEKSIGLNVRTIRIAQKLSQEELSARLQIRGCDITRSALAKIEVGQRHLYPDEILQLKEILEVSFDDIFYGKKHILKRSFWDILSVTIILERKMAALSRAN